MTVADGDRAFVATSRPAGLARRRPLDDRRPAWVCRRLGNKNLDYFEGLTFLNLLILLRSSSMQICPPAFMLGAFSCIPKVLVSVGATIGFISQVLCFVFILEYMHLLHV